MPMYHHILARYINPVFVETGVDVGGTVALAVTIGFSHIISIEANLQKCISARQRFASVPSVEIVHGDSGQILWEVIRDIDTPITFWLDGHEPKTPILEELAAIRRHPIKTHTILIDDIRIFRAKVAWALTSKVNEEMVRQDVLKINSDYEILYEDDECAKEDILVARHRKG